jgi:hypothetical protein
MSLSARTSSLLVTLILGAALLLPAAAMAQAEAATFRPACDLATDAAVSSALGVDVVGDDSVSYLYCAYQGGDTTVAYVTLSPDLSLPLMRLAFPDVTDTTVAGRAALFTPGDGSGTPPTVTVGLDDGVLMIQIMEDAGVADPAAAAVALGEALLATGPVTARQPEEASGPAIAFSGDPCQMVSPAELKGILGKKFITADVDEAGTGCTYQTDMNKEPIFVSLSVTEGNLGSLRSGQSVDLTVADRNALFWPDMSGLFVDVGGGRMFQVVLMGPSPRGGAGATRVQEQAAAIGQLAVSRMTPATQGSGDGTGSVDMPPGADCPLLSLQAIQDTTGLTFQSMPGGTAEGCVFVSDDQTASLFLGVQDAASLDDAWKEAEQSFDLPAPVTLDVAGHAAYGGSGSKGAAVAVDLAGLADMDGKILGVLLTGLPTTADQVEVARQLAAQVVAGM